MNIKLEPGVDCHSDLLVEIPADVVNSEREQIVRSIVSQARMPGYRPGKAPRAVVEKRFQSTIKEELDKRLMEKAVREGAKTKETRVLHVVKNEATANVDGTYTVRAELLVAPTFELPEYKDIPVVIPRVEVTEEHMDKALSDLCMRNADYEPEAADTTLAMGHFAELDYQAALEEVPVDTAEFAQLRPIFFGERRMLKIDEEVLLPGFAGNLIEHKVDEPFTFSLNVPEDFPIESVKGQAVTYSATIRAIFRQTIPQMNDETARAITNDEASTAEDLTKRVREGLTNRAEFFVRRLKAEQVLKHLHQDVDFELPKEMVSYETQQQVNTMVRRGLNQGATNEMIMEHEGKILDSASSQARREVKNNFIVNEIARRENIQVRDTEVFNRVAGLAEQANIPLKKAMRNVQRNGHVHNIVQELMAGKVLDFLIEKASVRTDESANALDQLLEQEGSQVIPTEV